MGKRKGGKRTRRRNGEGTVGQRADGYYFAQATLGKDRPTWVAKTEAGAIAKMDEAKRRYAEGLPVTSSSRTVYEWLQAWLSTVKEGKVRDRTLHLYRGRLQHAVEAFGDKQLKNLRTQDIENLYADMRKRNYAGATIAALHVNLKCAFDDAVKRKLLIANPCAIIDAPRVELTDFTTITPPQLARLVELEPNTQWKALWLLLGTTGMRIGEASALSWSHVDWSTHLVAIEHTLVRPKGGGWQIGPPKTKTSRRTVRLSEMTETILRRLHAEHMQSPIRSIEGFIFQSKSGKPLANQAVAFALQRALERAHLPRMRIHDLRHTAATNLLAAGVPIKVVSHMLGHASTTTTMDRYQHVVPADHAAAMALIERLMAAKTD